MQDKIPSWQKKYWDRFVVQRTNNTLPHALLFAGQTGSHALPFAQSLAKLFLCTEKKSQACGGCKSCQLFDAEAHPDYFFSMPLNKKSAEKKSAEKSSVDQNATDKSASDKSKVITVEQIRNLSHALMHTAQLNHYQVAIISPAHAMNSAAANALLKTLEEPPGPVIMMLITDKPYALPRTIYSRCQVIHFKKPLSCELEEGAVVTDLYTALYAAFMNKEKYDPIALAKFCMDFDVEEVLNNLLDITANLIKISSGLPAENSIPDRLKVSVNPHDIQKCFHYYDSLLDAKKLRDNNINFNTQSMLENLFISMQPSYK